MVNNSTNINKMNMVNNSPQQTKQSPLKESLNSNGQQFYQYQQTWTITSHLKKV